MRSKQFATTNGSFEMKIPADWAEYDSDEDGTYAFFNAKEWTGNLRITPYKNVDPSKGDMATKFLHLELEKNDSARKIKLGNFEVVTYNTDVTQDGEDLVVYYWVIGQQDNLLFCSFTVNKEMKFTQQNLKELNLVEEILSSIAIK